MICSISLQPTAFAGTTTNEESQNLWTYEFGVAFLTENTIGDILTGTITRDDTATGGEVYQFTATRFLSTLPITIGANTYHPLLEMPLCLEVVDENSRDPFFNYNAALQCRWIDFPWNDSVKTTFAVGLGLSYSEKLYLNDVRFHRDQERSHLKFNLPISLTFARPSHPDQELVIYIAHHSGGFGTFDRGGVNSLGMGLRCRF
jgi:hypothetical protein